MERNPYHHGYTFGAPTGEYEEREQDPPTMLTLSTASSGEHSGHARQSPEHHVAGWPYQQQEQQQPSSMMYFPEHQRQPPSPPMDRYGRRPPSPPMERYRRPPSPPIGRHSRQPSPPMERYRQPPPPPFEHRTLQRHPPRGIGAGHMLPATGAPIGTYEINSNLELKTIRKIPPIIGLVSIERN